MGVQYNNIELIKLIRYFYELTGVWINVHAPSGEDIGIRDEISPFCSMVQSTRGGLRRCQNCDAEAARTCMEINNVYHYRCHAGICETLVPIQEKGQVIAYLGFGQLLDDGPKDQQWQSALEKLSWFNGDVEKLKKAFFLLPQMPQKKMIAFAQILKSMSAYLQDESIVRSTQFTDQQLVESYLKEHYAEQISMAQVSEALSFGTTKISKLCKAISNGHTMTWIIGSYRINAAKKYLENTDFSVTEVSLLSGYGDFNYFTKVFKKFTGMTPSAYKKEATERKRQAADTAPEPEQETQQPRE